MSFDKLKFEAALAALYPDFEPATADEADDARIAVLNLVTDALTYARAEGLEDPQEICRYALETSQEESGKA